jgi:hypothetical protein
MAQKAKSSSTADASSGASETKPKSAYGKKQVRRSQLTAALMQLGIRIRYYLENLFGLIPLFSQLNEHPSPWRPKTCPEHDVITRVGFIFMWLLVGLTRETKIMYLVIAKTGILTLLNKFQDFLANRVISQMKAAGHDAAHSEVPIPEYDWKNGNPQEFYDTFVKRPHPVILRGFMKDSQLLKDFAWDRVLGRWGEEDVMLTKKELDGYAGKLKEVNNPSTYLHNSEVIFNKYPETRELFEYERLEPYLKMKVGYEQIFVGKQGTGSPFHNASVYNMFYMIDGKKKWWFIDPYDTFLAYPIILMGRAASVLLILWPTAYDKLVFPLFQYCPLYSAVVEPGDVLFNPPWWWHAIKNITEHSVAVASRWHTDGICGHTLKTTEENYNIYRWGSFAFFHGFSSIPFLHSILQTPSPQFDEHMTLREKNNRFVHLQIKHAENGGVDLAGVKTKF